jgi:flagellar M-ring protein FliF
VKKLSVAVVVDGTYTAGANGQRTYAPRSAADMNNITQLVRSAIGYDEKRGDSVQVTNMRFADIDTGSEVAVPVLPPLGLDSEVWFKLAQVLILSITALLVILLVVRPMVRRLTTPVAATQAGAAALGAPSAQAAGAVALPGAVPANPNAPAQIAGQGGPAPLQLPKRESTIDVSQIEGQVRESAVRKVGDVVQNHPEEAMAILRNWLHQPV